MDNDFEVLAFPDLFPYGSGGYHSANKKVKLPIRKYFQQCLLNVDGRFAQNIEYLFCAQYIADIKQIESDATLAIMLSQGRTLGGHKITAGQLWNPAVVEQLVRNEQAYKFLKNVRGSPAYWQDQLYDVLAMLQMLSIPTWFLTLSAADLHWPEMIQAVAVQFGKKLTQKDVLKMSIADRSKYLHQNPITCVQMFQHRLEAFFSEYLLSDTHPLGYITDYVIKIEFQTRGSPHAHCLLWVKDAPKIDKDPDDVVCALIDKYITAVMPPVTSENEHQIKLMDSLQKHTHSDYCCKNKSCHFGFPKPPATKTLISWPPLDNNDKIIENAKSLLQNVQNTLTIANVHNKSTQQFLQDINLDVETYMDALQISQRGPNVILKQNPQDVFINACNHDILSLWRGNADLQYVINEMATVKYVCSYMTKGEKGMGETLKRVAKECWNDAIRTQMNKIKKEFLGKRVLGAPESAMQVLSMWLMKKSRKVVSVSTSMKDECVSLPKPKSQLAQLHDEDENVFATSVIDRYAARPLVLQNICLATFAVMYDVIQSSTQTGEAWGCQYRRRHTQHRKCSFFDKDEIVKRIGCNQEEKTAGNTTYKKVQSPYRTRKILSFKASHLLLMESWRWHNINIPKLSWLIHQQTPYHTSECTEIQWRLCSIWHRPTRFRKQYTTVCMGDGCSKYCTGW